MSKPTPTPRPWKCVGRNLDGVFYIKNDHFENAAETLNEANAAHIVKCVNLHDDLVEVVRKVNELLKCEDGSLSATGKCNILLRELLNLVPANLVNKADGRDG